MSGHDIVVIGGSAGAVEAFRELTDGQPKSLPAAVFIVIHMSEDYPIILSHIVNKNSKLPAIEVKDGTPIEKGRIYIGCPGLHLVVD